MKILPPAELLYCEQQRLSLQTGTYLHRHKDFWQLQFFTEGEAIALLGKGGDCMQIELQPECLLFTPPEAYHGIQKSEGGKGSLLCLDFKFRINDANLSERLLEMPYKMELRDELKPLLNMIHKTERQDFRDAYFTALLYRIIELKPLENNARRISHDKASLAAQRYIEEHCCEQISTESICSSLGYNKSYLCTAFKNDFHYTIGKYIMAKRIERASEMLIYSDKGLLTIASETGFKSVPHFCRVFKEHTGYPPQQFRIMRT